MIRKLEPTTDSYQQFEFLNQYFQSLGQAEGPKRVIPIETLDIVWAVWCHDTIVGVASVVLYDSPPDGCGEGELERRLGYGSHIKLERPTARRGNGPTGLRVNTP